MEVIKSHLTTTCSGSKPSNCLWSVLPCMFNDKKIGFDTTIMGTPWNTVYLQGLRQQQWLNHPTSQATGRPTTPGHRPRGSLQSMQIWISEPGNCEQNPFI